ncbi:hypothetical protein [Streptomyces sp. NPDC056883]|uniref:non-homologous end-joining DNA ligase LigD n=1 Tax=Streptomyces sp. NPDC056883 TaxID=3345959 RepID=UPI0036BD9349
MSWSYSTAAPPFDDVRAFARGVAEVLAARHPARFTTEARKKTRRGRLSLDIQRNAYAQTAAPPLRRPRPPRRPRRGPRWAGAISTNRTSPPAAGPWPPTTACSRSIPGGICLGPGPSEAPRSAQRTDAWRREDEGGLTP